ncbi:complex I NDUFA9 subunit family protein [Brevibacillus sp. H7]|uniref:complex I NDUFA9 subunit family protein n=1 Tax=Brevibacillus sp. H7 TaxID=3349138 RepID=UPI0038026967
MKVLVTGSTGFVGTGIVAKLAEDGHQAVCLVRPGSEHKRKRDRVAVSAVTFAPGDLFDTDSLERAAEGCDAVIHLVGIIREQPGRGVTFSRIHVTGTQNVLAAAKRAGVRRFVHMSALGAREGAASAYHQTKYAAEQLVRQSGIPHTIFRPSVIFGPGDAFVNMLADIVRLPVTPVIGDGSYLLQPVSRVTVADVFSQALSLEQATNQIFEAGGPQPLSYEQILEAIGRAIGKKRLNKVHIPLALMKPLISMMEGFSFFPITNTQLTMLLEGNACKDTERLYNVFQTKKIPFQEGIEMYLR